MPRSPYISWCGGVGVGVGLGAIAIVVVGIRTCYLHFALCTLGADTYMQCVTSCIYLHTQYM